MTLDPLFAENDCLLNFLRRLDDEDIGVKRAAVLTLNNALRNKALLVRPHMAELMPLLLKQTAVLEKYIRVVDLGPFKHKIDDGLDLRKVCILTIVPPPPPSLSLSLSLFF